LVEKPLSGVVSSGDECQFVRHVSASLDLPETRPHADGNPVKAGIAESTCSILRFLAMAGDAAVYREMGFPCFAYTSQFGKETQQFVPRFPIQAPSVEDHQILYGLKG